MVDEEEEEEEEYGGQATGEASCTVSQDLFLTPPQSGQSCQSSTGEPNEGEQTSSKCVDKFSVTGMVPRKQQAPYFSKDGGQRRGLCVFGGF